MITKFESYDYSKTKQIEVYTLGEYSLFKYIYEPDYSNKWVSTTYFNPNTDNPNFYVYRVCNDFYFERKNDQQLKDFLHMINEIYGDDLEIEYNGFLEDIEVSEDELNRDYTIEKETYLNEKHEFMKEQKKKKFNI